MEMFVRNLSPVEAQRSLRLLELDPGLANTSFLGDLKKRAQAQVLGQDVGLDGVLRWEQHASGEKGFVRAKSSECIYAQTCFEQGLAREIANVRPSAKGTLPGESSDGTNVLRLKRAGVSALSVRQLKEHLRSRDITPVGPTRATCRLISARL